MCDQHHHAPGEDEWSLDTPAMRGFVGFVREQIAAASSPEDACERIRPRFAELLADPGWLPESLACDAPESGMGGGIGQWALFRAGDGTLSLFSLVVPPGAETPVHDHLAWGLVGLYRGEQDEDVYEIREGLAVHAGSNRIGPGDFYTLIPPDGDVHRVRTTSAATSVSIHLLTNDTGCIWRHRYDAETGVPSPFRSGYVNADCPAEEAA